MGRIVRSHSSPNPPTIRPRGSLLVYFALLCITELPMYRDDPLFIRDWGLLIWTIMLIFSQLHFMSIVGVSAFSSDPGQIIDIFANGCMLNGCMLQVCHGKSELLSWVSNCESWPVTVPVAAWEVMSVGIVLQGLRCTRLIEMHPTFGPLMLAVYR